MTHASHAVPRENLIAVGTDFTPSSKTAIERATQLAKSNGSRLLFIHVIPESAVHAVESAAGSPPAVVPAPTPEGRAALRGASDLADERLAASEAGIEADAVVRPGRPYEALAETAEMRHARLLVLGVAAPLAAGESFFLGTTAERALRHGSTPVLLARSKTLAPYHHVLLPVDLGETSLRVLRLVGALLPAAEYDVVHFVPPNASHEDKSRVHRETVSASVSALCAQAGLDVSRTRVRTFVAEPRAGIVGEISNRVPDLIAMGTHARSGIARVMLGSVADYVIHAANGIDVLAVPPEKNA